MADILITVGVDRDLSLNEFQQGIKNLVNDINNSPLPKVKLSFDFDEASVNKIKTQINEMNKAAFGAKTIKGLNIKTVPGASIAKNTAEINRNTDAKNRNAVATKQASKADVDFSLGSQKHAAALKKTITLYDRLTGNLKAWSAASKGSTKGAYNELKGLVTQLGELRTALSRGEIDLDKFNKRFIEINTGASQYASEIKEAGRNTKSFGNRIGGAAKKFASWLTASQIIMYAISSIRKMGEAAIEVESSMAQIQIVTGATDAQMQTFLTNSISLAKELGRSVTDVAASIETFARLGYNMQDASNLSKYANIMANVGNTDIDTATTGITSIIKGYQLSPDDAEHVADVLVEVGQKYAISAEELMAAFQRGGAALHASGTDFEKSAALFAATNASLQNAETTGVMWKTISARIRGAKTELMEMGEYTDDIANGFSKYRDEIKGLSGVDIMKDADTYKDMFEIFVEIASSWDDMTGVSQARVAEILGGTRNTSGVMSTIANINDALGAYKDAMNSAGTSAEANAIYMDTTKAKIEELKAAFQELSSDFISSDFSKGAVTALKSIVEIIDKIVNSIGSLQTLLLGFGIFRSIKGIRGILSSTSNDIKNVIKAAESGEQVFAGIFDVLKNDDSISFVTGKFSDVKKAMVDASSSGKGAFATLASGANALFGALTPLVTVTAAIGAGFLAWNLYDNHIKQQAQDARDAATAWDGTSTSLTDYKNRVVELRDQLSSGILTDQEAYQAKSELLTIQQSLSDSYGDQFSGIDLVNGSMREQIRLMDEIAQRKASEFLVDNRDAIEKAEKEMTYQRAYSLGGYKPGRDDATSKAIDKSIKVLKKKYGDVINVGKDIGGEAHISITGDVSQAKSVLEDFRADVVNITNDIGENDILKGLMRGTDESLGYVNETLNEYKQIYDTSKSAEIAADTKEYKGLNGELKTATEWMREYKNAVDKYNTALASGDSTKITVAKGQFEAIDKAIKSLLKSDMSKYADSFNKVGNELDTAAINARKLENIINGVGVKDGSNSVDSKVKKYSDAYNNLANEQKKIVELGLEDFGNAFDTSGKSFVQSKFGNVDMDKRTIITWSEELKNTYQEALSSWNYDPKIGGIDTVFGSSDRFGEDTLKQGVEVAFTPIMNVDGKTTFLDKGTVYAYIEELVKDATVDGVFSEEKMLSLDKEGRKVGNTFVKGLVAATDEGLNYANNGNWAETVGRLMHFSGDYGAIALAYDDINAAAEEAGISTEEFIDSFQNTDKASKGIKKTADALKELEIDDKDFVYAFETKGVQKGEKEIKKLVDVALDAGIISDTSTESLQSLADILVELGIISGEPVNNFAQIATNLENATLASQGFISEVSSLQQILSNQHSGKSISVADFNSEALDGYRDALEYTNGTMQVNIEKSREIAKAKAEEQIATNNVNKVLAQDRYLENTRQIEKYRKKIEEANFAKGETAASVQSSIDALLAENSTIAGMCKQYDLLSISIQETIGSYQHWLNAQNAADYGEMADDAVSAIQRIQDTYDSNSEIFRQFGSRKFDAAVEFIIPESVDRDDLSAIESYMASVQEYLNFGENGAIDSLNIDQFLQKSVEAGLMSYSEDEGFKILGGKKMADFAEGLNMSSGLVQAFFDEMQLYDGEFDWGDEVVKTTGDLIVEANEAAEALRKLDENKDLKIKLDYSDLKTTDEQIKMLDDTIAEMDGIKSRVDVDSTDVERANAIIQYCLDQKHLLTQPEVLRVDTSNVEGDLGEAISLLQEFYETQNQLEIQTKIGVDTSLTEEKLDSLLTKIQGLSPKVKADLEIDSTSAETIKQSIKNLTANQLIKVGVSADAISGYDKKTEKVKVIYDPDVDKLPKSFKAIKRDVKYKAKGHDSLPESFSSITREVKYVAVGDTSGGKPKKPKKKDKQSLNGTAHSSGTARAGGDWGTAPGGRTLVGELGREIVVNPRSGKWYTVGDNGAEFVDVPAGSIVFNHLQTEDLLANGYVSGRASALVSGTAMVTGGIKPYYPTTRPNRPGSNSSNSYRPPSYSSSSSSRSINQANDSAKEFEETIDFIEIAINRITKAINRVKIIAESTFNTLSERNNAALEQISAITSRINIQEQAYQRYMAEANSIGLSESWARMVRDGAIDIKTIKDESLANKIKEYKEFYEKAIDAKDAIAELHEEIANLYKDRFDNVAKDFENQLDLLEHLTKTYDNGIKDLEEKGYLASTKYYEAMKGVESQNIKVLESELAGLINSMSEAVNSGEVQEGSSAWYDMQKSINSVKEAIQESQTKLVEFDNTIRKINWDRFNYLQELIGNITSESDFMIKLMKDTKLFTDKGKFTDTGMASLGMHGQNYNVYMAQSDKYAEELKKLNAEIANDPNNTKLLERRQELLKAQRESILAAEDEKQSIKDLVEEGIKIELNSLQDLIDKYLDAMDTARDLYDYQKRVKEQTNEIASLQKQLAAYAGDNSEEAKATIQQIQVDLSKAQEDLEETQYDRYISEQKKLLDTLYDEYELILNSRLDNIDALMSEMIDTINANSGSINETLIAQSDKVGYDLSESMKSIWSNEGGATSIITKYGEAFTSAFTSVNNVLNAISLKVAKMADASDKTASSTTATTKPTTSATSRPSGGSSSSSRPSSSSSTSRSDKDYYGVALAISNGGYGWGMGSTRMSRLSAKGFNASRVQGIVNQLFNEGYIRTGAWVGRYYGIRDLSPYGYNRYKKGGLVDYTGLAQLDGTPSEPELVLNAKDTANFIALKDAIKNISDGNSPLSDLFGDGASAQIIENLARIDAPNGKTSTTIGDVSYHVNIPIDHVQDYNDFMNQMKADGKFEKFIRSMTVDRLSGGSKLSKNKYQW